MFTWSIDPFHGWTSKDEMMDTEHSRQRDRENPKSVSSRPRPGASVILETPGRLDARRDFSPSLRTVSKNPRKPSSIEEIFLRSRKKFFGDPRNRGKFFII
jgi:hypothetical protein